MLIEWIVGCTFIAIFAYQRYNNPDTNRSSTTYFNFIQYFLLYLASLLTIYVVLTAFLDSSPEALSYVLTIATGGSLHAELESSLKGMNSPIVAVLILTTLLPILPYFSKIDKALLRFFWDRGHIPIFVITTTEKLMQSSFAIHVGRCREIKDLMTQFNLPEEALQKEPDDSIEYDWTRLAALYIQVSKWSNGEESGYRNYMQDQSYTMDEFETSFSLLNSKYLKLIETKKSEQAVDEEYEQYLRADIRRLLKMMIGFVVRAVFQNEYTEQKRTLKFTDLGFDQTSTSGLNLTPEQLFKVVSLIMLLFIIMGFVKGTFGIGGSFSLVLINSGNFGAALLCVIALKNWPQFVPDIVTRTRPWFYYLLASLLATAVCFFVMFAIRYIENMIHGMEPSKNWTLVQDKSLRNSPYLVASFVLAFITAYVADSYACIFGELPKKYRFKDIAIYTGGMFVAAILVYNWLHGIVLVEPTKDACPIEMAVDKCWLKDSFLTTNFFFLTLEFMVLGAAIGALVPFWYRTNRSKEPIQKLYRLLHQHKQEFEKEARLLNEGELEQALLRISFLTAYADQKIDRSEKLAMRHALNKIARIDATDLVVEETLVKFNRELVDCYVSKEFVVWDLDEVFEPFIGHKHFKHMFVYYALTIVYADQVLKDCERETVEKIVTALGLKSADFDLRLKQQL